MDHRVIHCDPRAFRVLGAFARCDRGKCEEAVGRIL